MLSSFFINRPKFAIVIAVLITLSGLIALVTLPIAEYPEIAPPQVKRNLLPLEGCCTYRAWLTVF